MWKESDMRMMGVLLTVLILAPLAHARPPTAAQVHELLVVSNTQAVMEDQLGELEAQIIASLERSMPEVMNNPADNARMREEVAADARSMHELLQWQRIEPRIIAIYQTSMDEADVKALTAFYRTPAGARAMAKLPLMMAQVQQFIGEVVGDWGRRRHGMAPILAREAPIVEVE
jgi:hypothetical protein